ncbi:hypothetical protein [Agromyces sp. PvR057]|uniref:hypothetical protein n=1 Tax=Agromyces sp. PvR057 TaxID=3156403 RepID=UPI001313EA39
MPRETVSVVRAEQRLLSKGVRRVASVVGRRVVVVPCPHVSAAALPHALGASPLTCWSVA